MDLREYKISDCQANILNEVKSGHGYAWLSDHWTQSVIRRARRRLVDRGFLRKEYGDWCTERWTVTRDGAQALHFWFQG